MKFTDDEFEGMKVKRLNLTFRCKNTDENMKILEALEKQRPDVEINVCWENATYLEVELPTAKECTWVHLELRERSSNP